MALLKIRVYGDPILRKRAEPVAEITDDLRRLLGNMKETMYIARGVGLAANQVGKLHRFLILDVDQVSGDSGNGGKRKTNAARRNPIAFINPEILESSTEDASYKEGCLSLPGLEGEVFRPERVRVRYQDEEGQVHEREADGLLARVLQHEIDHLDGVLFVDRMESGARRMLAGQLSRLRQVAEENPEGIPAEKSNP
jgi:peptide deformylase